MEDKRTEEDDDQPQLSADTLAALQEVMLALQARASDSETEDWSLNQFWYTDGTTAALLDEICSRVGEGSIAFLSVPSLYFAATKDGVPNRMCLFEYDRRFDKENGQFCFWDCNAPEDIPAELHHSFDYVFGDPPFLNEETCGNFLKAAQLLARTERTPIAIVTASTLSDFVCASLKGAYPSSFHVAHRQLQNPMTLYLTYRSPNPTFAPLTY